MDPQEVLKVAADWSLAAVLAVVLIYVLKQSEKRTEDLITRIVGVIEKNTQALADIRPALVEISRFMDAVEKRLAAIEDRLEVLARRGEHIF